MGRLSSHIRGRDGRPTLIPLTLGKRGETLGKLIHSSNRIVRRDGGSDRLSPIRLAPPLSPGLSFGSHRLRGENSALKVITVVCLLFFPFDLNEVIISPSIFQSFNPNGRHFSHQIHLHCLLPRIIHRQTDRNPSEWSYLT